MQDGGIRTHSCRLVAPSCQQTSEEWGLKGVKLKPEGEGADNVFQAHIRNLSMEICVFLV